MKTLYLVPVIHTSPDMGSLASALEETASAELGQKLWQEHKATLAAFWDSIARFFRGVEVRGFKIYQDGLVADGAEGARIIREGISQGSKNYQIIGELLERGAVLMKTENLDLVKQEHAYVTKVTQAKSQRERAQTALGDRAAQSKLLRQRDDFIANRIKETLGEGETGILFIGAYHDILPRLPHDIQVVQVKEVARVREYHLTLATTRKCSRRFHQLALYLASPTSNTSLQKLS